MILTEAELDRALDCYIANLSDGYVPFNGDEDCDEGCLGWNGINFRCECGNQRVSWGMYEDEHGDVTFFGEAF